MTRAGRVPVGQHLAVLSSSLTQRDLRLCRLLAAHSVLTTRQISDLLAFPSQARVEQRLRALHRLQVLDRFQPRQRPYHGGVAYHYVLGVGGAAVLAAEQGQDPAQLRHRRDRALALAYSPQLPHLVAVNDFFARLARTANQIPTADLAAWWPARRCSQRWRVIHPDGYGRWRQDDREVDFFVEVDRGTEPHARLLAKLTGYTALAQATATATPVLVWFVAVGPEREAKLRAAFGVPPVPVATAVAQPNLSPAAAVWRKAGHDGPPQRLITLRGAW